MEWRKPDDCPENDDDVVIYYISATDDKEHVWIGWYNPNVKSWFAVFDQVKTLLAWMPWMPLPPAPNFEKDEKEN